MSTAPREGQRRHPRLVNKAEKEPLGTLGSDWDIMLLLDCVFSRRKSTSRRKQKQNKLKSTFQTKKTEGSKEGQMRLEKCLDASEKGDKNGKMLVNSCLEHKIVRIDE